MKSIVMAYQTDAPPIKIGIDTQGAEYMDFRQQRVKNMSDEDAYRQELLRRRLEDPDEKKQFRKAYAFKVGVDYSTLKPFCEEVLVVIDGLVENTDIVRAKLELALVDYDSDKDVIVVVGRAIDNLLVGMVVSEKVRLKPKARQSFAIAVYYGYSYRFYEVSLDPTLETRRIQIK